MKRAKEIQTPIGQAAYSMYSKWMKMNRRSVPDIDVFKDSRLYTSFVKFARYTQQVDLADVDVYLRLMVKQNIQPNLWMHDKVYNMYLEYMDYNVCPIERMELMMSTIGDLSEVLNCDVPNVIPSLSPHECQDLLRKRVFTPWLLMKARGFGALYAKCSQEERNIFGELLNTQYWTYMFHKHPDTVAIADNIVAELDL
jgi:hypothetical protein